MTESVKTVSLEDLANHITQLAVAHEISVAYVTGVEPKSWKKHRTMVLPPIKSYYWYARALHEFGHILGEQRGPRIDKELEAWLWAKENALIWGNTMEIVAVHDLRFYVKWANNHKRAIKPGANHPVFSWITMKWWDEENGHKSQKWRRS